MITRRGFFSSIAGGLAAKLAPPKLDVEAKLRAWAAREDELDKQLIMELEQNNLRYGGLLTNIDSRLT